MAWLIPTHGRWLRPQAQVLPALDLGDTYRRTPRTLVQAFPESEGYRFALHGPYRQTLAGRLATRFWRLLGARS